jgi:hypothetical protein
MIEHLAGEEIVKHIEELKKEAKEFYSDSNKLKDRCEKFYKGEQWKGGSESRSVKNLIFSTIEDELPVLVDQIPTVDVVSTDESEEAEQSAKSLESAIHYSFKQGCIPLKIPMAVRDSLKTGVGFIYVDWNQDSENGAGLVSYSVKNWKSILIDPMASDIDDASYAIIQCPMRLADIKRLYPSVTEEQLENTISPTSLDQIDSNTTGANGNESHWTIGGPNGNGKSRFAGRDIYIVDECWLKDYSLIPIDPKETVEEIEKEKQEILNAQNPDVTEYEDHGEHISAHEALIYQIVAETLQIDISQVTENDIENVRENDPTIGLVIEVGLDHITSHENMRNEHTDGMKPAYQNNLRLVIKIGNSLPLYDGPAPVEDGMIPLVPFYCYKDSESPEAIGEVENLIKAQMSYNEMDHAELSGLLLSTNPGWICDTDSGIDPDSITNKVGMVLVPKAGSRCERINPGVISNQLSVRKDSDREIIQSISGIRDQVNGEGPKNVIAGFAQEKLRQQAIGRIRLKTRFLELHSMLRLGKLTASRIVKYWSQERILRLRDNDGNLKTIKFDPEKLIDLNYEIDIVPSTMAGIDKSSIYSAMAEQVQLGVLPAKTYIKSIDIPNKSMILKDLEQNDLLANENAQLKQMLAQYEQMINPKTGAVNTDQVPSQGL